MMAAGGKRAVSAFITRTGHVPDTLLCGQICLGASRNAGGHSGMAYSRQA